MITVIHLRDSPFVGGPEKQILGQCKRLDRARFDPVIASFTRSEPNALLQAARNMHIRTETISDGKLAFFKAVKELRALIQKLGNCVVITSGFKADMTAALACADGHTPWITWFHGWTGATLSVRLYEAIDFLALRRADVVAAVCERTACQLRNAGLHNVITIPNAIDVDSIASQGTRESARHELGIRGSELVIGVAARLSIEKGLCYFIDSARMILRKYPMAQFVVVGDGPQRSDLERRVRMHGVDDRFIFTGLRSDAVVLIKAMDIFVLPSLRENMPVALLEAMACGVYVVATDVGGVGEVLDGTGIKPILSGSSKAIADNIVERIDANWPKEKYVENLNNRAREFSFDKQVVLMEEAIKRAKFNNRL